MVTAVAKKPMKINFCHMLKGYCSIKKSKFVFYAKFLFKTYTQDQNTVASFLKTSLKTDKSQHKERKQTNGVTFVETVN